MAVPKELRKSWPVTTTAAIARESHEYAEHGDVRGCARVYIRLLRKHQEYMIPQGERWLRAGETIRNLEGQG